MFKDFKEDGMPKCLADVIIPFWVMLIFVVIIAVVVACQWGIASVIEDNTVKQENVACVVESWDQKTGFLKDDKIIANLDCGGTKDATRNRKFIGSYLKSRGPFVCTMYKNPGDPDCHMIPPPVKP